MPRILSVLLLMLTGCTQPRSVNPASEAAKGTDPLPSWNDGATKTRILEFVTRTTTEGGPDFVPAEQRIAVFDNDGTLWSEQPMYFEVLFAFDRVKAMAPAHPDWKTKQPFKGIMEGDMKAVAASGEKGVVALMAATHSGMTQESFDTIVHQWVQTARHPVTKRPYTDMIYQPQRELMTHLRSRGYKTFIVSGGGVDFMRPWTDSIYGIPPEQVVGSRGKLKYEIQNGRPVLLKLPAADLIDDKAGKPVGIAQQIGRRPVIAVGNSDGDYQMLDYTTTSGGPRLGIYIHHDDAAREYAYDRASHIGTLAMGLDSASAKGWLVTSMKNDWKTIYPQHPDSTK